MMLQQEVSNLKNLTLLYVEDERDTQEEALEYFRDFFKEVYSADDGEEALDYYEYYKPDIIILDIKMPKKGGLSVAKEIAEDNPKIPIIMLSAYETKEYLHQSIKARVYSYLIKPINYKALKEVFLKIHNEYDTLIQLSQNYSWNPSTKILYKFDTKIFLSNNEQKLLALLIKHKNMLVSYEKIEDYLWGQAVNKNSIINVKKGLQSHIGDEIIIENIRGRGYKLFL